MKDYKNPIKATMNKAKDNLLDIADSIYQQGYEAGKADTPFTDTEEAEEKAYNRGLNEAWEVAGKLFKVPTDALLELFERRNPYLDFSAQEVLAKIKAYEDKQKQDDWRDIPSDEMTLDQARRAVKQLRAEVVGKILVEGD